jgi:hypothetical protein
MQKKRKMCAVPGCTAPMHARGYCRRHYSQLWRGRRSNSGEEGASRAREHIHDDPERIRALERELKKAEHMYEVVVGFEGRVKWRREMEAVKAELRRLGITPPAAAFTPGPGALVMPQMTGTGSASV